MENPFSYIKLGVSKARGRAFIGRQRWLAQIMQMIAAPNPHHVSIYGLPHIGKSSFLLKLYETLSQKEDYLCIQPQTLTEGDFCNNLDKIIRVLLRKHKSLNAIADALEEDSPAEERINMLRQALQILSSTGRRIVLMLDEFERILGPTDVQIAENISGIPGWTQEEYELFLDLLMDRRLNVVCITASRPHMDNLLYRYRPAQNPFVPMLLNGFDDAEMKEYFEILRQGDIRLDGIALGQEPEQSQQQELLRLCGRSPYLLTLMGNELFENSQGTAENPGKTVKGLFDRCRGTVEDYFNDVVYFMAAEEQKKMRSFSHVVKCYFGPFEDYQDIKERCIANGYLELMAKTSPYTYRGKVFEFEDRDDKFQVIQQNGCAMTKAEKKRQGLVYVTVSPLFTDYLFAVREPIGKKRIIPLEMIDDPRDLLTGLIYALRDITRKEIRAICPREHISPNRWDELLVSRYMAVTRNGGQQIIHVNSSARSNSQRYALLERTASGVVRGQPKSAPGSEPTTTDWQTLWNNRTIPVASTSMKFVIDRIRSADNEMASLDPISLTDHMEIFAYFWQYDNRPMFSGYFSILPKGESQLRAMMEHLREYRNKVSHFSRYGYGPNEILYSKIYCRQLLKGIYYYLYSGKSCPVGSIADTPGV